MFRFTNLPKISQSNTIVIIVSVSNHRKDKKVGGVTQGRHLSDMGATFTLHCYFYTVHFSVEHCFYYLLFPTVQDFYTQLCNTFTPNCALQCGMLLLYFVVPLWTLQLPVWSVSRLQAGSLDNHSLIPGKSHWTSIVVLINIFACVHWLNFINE